MKPDWSDGGKEKMMVGYEEGPWLMKRGDTYYLSYPAGGVPEHMAYSTAKSVHGPWTYRGRIMDEAENSFIKRCDFLMPMAVEVMAPADKPSV